MKYGDITQVFEKIDTKKRIIDSLVLYPKYVWSKLSKHWQYIVYTSNGLPKGKLSTFID